MACRRRAAVLGRAAALGLAALWLAAPAGAQAARENTPGSTASQLREGVPTDPDQLVSPSQLDRPPPRHKHSALQVLAIADRVSKVRRARRGYPGNERYAYLKGPTRWQVSYFARLRPGQSAPQRREIAQVLIDDRSGAVLESWTGHQVAWTMARGYPGAFGRRAVALYIWIPLTLLFVAPFVDRRRLRSLRNLDLLVLASFSVSLAFFSHGRIGASVPLAYPPLVYLLLRMLLAARARARVTPADADHDRARPDPPDLLVPVSWLVVALVFLVGFRIGLNVLNSNVIDVGYAGVIGADRVADGERLYGDFPSNNDHGDTYGPVNYYAYVPFEQVWPWSGKWDALPAAHGAAVGFDLLTLVLLFALGARVRGRRLGVALAYGWAAYPFTLFVSSSNSNDSLVAALVVAALLAAGSPAARGALAALAALTKFAPLVLVPLLALYRPTGADPDARAGIGPRTRTVLVFALAFAVTALAAMVPVLLDGGLRLFFERTIEYQTGRDSPFSLYGLVGGLGWLQIAVQVAGAIIALVVAVVPLRRDVVTLAALTAAILIAVQLGVTHWFYLYVVWFFPAVLLVVLAQDLPPPWRAAPTSTGQPEAEAARSTPPASVAMP